MASCGGDDASISKKIVFLDEGSISEETGHGRSHKGLGMYLAAIFIVGEMAGAGILNLPKATANTGWVGVPMLIVLCLLVGYSGSRLALCWTMLEDRWEEYKSPCKRPYPAIAYRALGTPGRYIVEIALNITLFGTSAVYIIVIGQRMEALLEPYNTGLTACEWILVAGALLTVPSWLGTPKDMWPASIIAVLCTVVACFVVIIECIIEREDHPAPIYAPPTFSTFFLGFGSILFSFGGACIFPTIQNDMRDRSEFFSSVVVGFLVLLGLYAPVSTITYGVLGEAVAKNILDSVSGVAVTIATALIVCHFAFATIIVVNPLMQTLEGIFKIPNKFGLYRCIARTSVICLALLLCLAVPSFSNILDLLGGSTISTLSFIMPPICFYKLSSAINPLTGMPYREVDLKEKILLASIVVLGGVGGVVSTVTAFETIISPGAFDRSCFDSSTFL